MSGSLLKFEQQHTALLAQTSRLADFRANLITVAGGRCGTLGRHCHLPADSGNALHPRLTYKLNEKTVTENFPSPAA